ncbi:MAG: DinB family protein [Anaerolineales bacterium]|nr:DinB family protein [Anaerolineales bacterium]
MLAAITHALALAARLEDEGQFNQAKLLRAACASRLTQAAHQFNLPSNPAAWLDEADRAIQSLAELGTPDDLLAALRHARAAQAAGRLSQYAEAPDPFVCRTCGHVSLGPVAGPCPTCGAQPATFQRWRGTYWLEALDPFAALEHLRSTPKVLAGLVADLPEALVSQPPEDGSWSLRQTIAHLRDAQGVLEERVNLILDQENPPLASQAVFAWARSEAGRPPALREILEAYYASRARTLARLESLPPADWWRRGRHEEFGELCLYHQVSYFACHELVHFPQLERLRPPAA